jgi:G:T-mismatch repair DNA endonuclease (very short patch repair protein)
LIIAEKICKNCIDGNQCFTDSCKVYTFYDNDSFNKWLFTKENAYFTALAHNMKGYDGVFLLNNIFKNYVIKYAKPTFLLRGTKILTLKYRDVKIIDSMSFMPMSLENFPKTFGITEMKKGYFPHLFNIPENNFYVGTIPDKKYYAPELFNESKKKEFDTWYNKNEFLIFDFQKEIYEYCLSDVKLLKEGCLQFRKIILSVTGIDPFEKNITIASLCHHIYRAKIMKEKSIPLIPDNGYMNQKTSKLAELWLKWTSHKNNVHIQHAKNGGEVKIDQYYVDGYSKVYKNDSIIETIYEIHGCFYHGCPKCYSVDTFNPVKQKLMTSVYREHLARINYLRLKLPNVKFEEIWECQINKKLLLDKNFKEFSKKIEYRDPISPRDSLFGGRTNAIKLYYNCNEDEKIKYYDFTSLYPWAQKYCAYPKGHPTIITENFQNIENYFGLVKCKILAPIDLYIPVLPVRVNGKLIFPLCRSCAEDQSNTCSHNIEERCFEGTWVTEEVKKANSMGYKIIKIYEVWHFDEKEIYDKNTKTGGIFTDYINMFLKLKQEASGYPSNVLNETDKDNYIKEYYEKEGIILDKSKIAHNSGLRNVMKLMLNSFWGRFALRSNNTKIKYITSLSDWVDLMTDQQYVVQEEDFTMDGGIIIYYTQKNEFDSGINTVNSTIAAFVTCYARLKLYSELEKLGDRVLYFDTDSMIFVEKNGLYSPKLGDYLGELTDEISPKDGNYIKEFVSAGPKNYSYTLDTGKQKCVVKGFKLNVCTSQHINYDSIKNIVLNDKTNIIQVDQLKFSRNKEKWEVNTSMIKKNYRFVYDKRILNDDLSTLPYGYMFT